MSSPIAENGDQTRQLARRRPRFRRHDPPRLRLTTDDIAILRHVAEHRFLRSTHLTTLLNRPAKKIVERLGKLYHNAYLDRPRAQLDYYATAGSAPLVYGLGNKGADLLAEIDGHPRTRVDWTDKNRTATRIFIDHTLMIANFMIAVELAVRRRSDLRLIGPRELLAAMPPATRASRDPWLLSAMVEETGKPLPARVIPDKVFALESTCTGERRFFFVEADRGTMPVTRSHPRQTSYDRKLRTYLAIQAKGVHRDRLGFANFRVLTITTTSGRIDTMVAALKQVTRGKGSNQFLFTHRSTLAGSSDVLLMEWITGKGETARLHNDAVY